MCFPEENFSSFPFSMPQKNKPQNEAIILLINLKLCVQLGMEVGRFSIASLLIV